MMFSDSTGCVRVPLRVRYAETDQMGVVYYANYLVWFEVGRAEFCRKCGFAYSDMERDHALHLAVVESHCRYRRPARYDDLLTIETSLEYANRKMVAFLYRVCRDADGEVLAEGQTVHVVLDKEGKLASMPEHYVQLLTR